jgi:hypothetical protein
MQMLLSRIHGKIPQISNNFGPAKLTVKTDGKFLVRDQPQFKLITFSYLIEGSFFQGMLGHLKIK